jgi:hypothetical protein
MGNKIIEETGNTYGRLTVLRRGPNRKSSNNAYWECRCACGDILVVLGSELRRGQSGCKSCSNGRPDSGLTFLYNTYKSAAPKRKHIFKLTKQQFKNITSSVCNYCREPPSKICKSREGYNPYLYNGVDRVNNDLGYILENCVACCATCNLAKRMQTAEDFLSWVKKIYKYQEEKKNGS